MSNEMPITSSATAVICCAVLEEEVRYLARGAPQVTAIHVLPQGLHNTPPLLREKLQAAVDEVEQAGPVEAIALVYGLCSRGVENVAARRARLVIPRAHDCITLLLGSKERYAQYVQQNPGTYWYSPGWNKHHIPPGQERHRKLYEEYRQKFSEEDAQYLMETEQAWFAAYERATYVDLGISDATADVAFTQHCADWLKWSFDQQHGDPQLLRDLLAGPWDNERFLVLEPGEGVKMTADERIIDRVALTINGQRVETPR